MMKSHLAAVPKPTSAATRAAMSRMSQVDTAGPFDEACADRAGRRRGEPVVYPEHLE